MWSLVETHSHPCQHNLPFLQTSSPAAAAADHEDSGETCVLVAVNATPVAVMAIADPLKPEARWVVAALQQQVRARVRALVAE